MHSPTPRFAPPSRWMPPLIWLMALVAALAGAALIVHPLHARPAGPLMKALP